MELLYYLSYKSGAVYLYSLDFLAYFTGVVVEYRYDIKIHLAETAVRRECRPEVSCPAKAEVPFSMEPQDLADLFFKFLDIITDALPAEFAEIGKVFSYLVRIYLQGSGKFAGANGTLCIAFFIIAV